ncbi:MAG: cadherin domain-containing protein [Gemmataceae bacterium]|nr:cadherin domain-containing protein [Gemmataceae bacterium]
MLEDRTLLTTSISLDNGNLLIEDTLGGDTDDALTIQADVANARFVVSDPNNVLDTSIPGAGGGGTNSVTVPFSAVTGSQIVVNTFDGGDSLTIDAALGGFATSISYDGGTGTDVATFLGDPALGAGALSVIAETINLSENITAAAINLAGAVHWQGSLQVNTDVGGSSDGTLDPTFHGDGLATTNVGLSDLGTGMAIQPNGKIVVVGQATAPSDVAVLRYLPNGTLDLTFGGGDGIVFEHHGGLAPGTVMRAVALEPGPEMSDRKIVVVGQDQSSFAVWRFLPSGARDTSFSGDGITRTLIAAGGNRAMSVVVQQDQKIVAAGVANAGGSSPNFAVVRYLIDGTLDPTFGGGDGIVTTSTNVGTFDQAQSLILQPDNKIVAVGSSGQFALVRYHSDGSLDTSFGGDGIVNASMGGTSMAFSGVLQADGKILAGGSSNGGAFALARFLSDGSLDPSFGGGDGKVTTNIGYFREQINSVLVQSDGRIVAVGTVINGLGISDFALVRYHSDGTLDTSFGGGDGIVITDVSPILADVEVANAAVLQPDGKIVLAGSSNRNFSLARYAGLGSGAVILTSSAALAFDLNGTTPGTQYDQLTALGIVNLGGARLDLTLGFTPPVGASFTIVNNNGADPVNGTFTLAGNSLAEGSSFTAGGVSFSITYAGGSGNDVVLTVIDGNQPPTLTADLASVTSDEGGVAMNTGLFSDPQGNSTVTITADIGSVTQDNTAGNWSWSLPAVDGPEGPVTVTITATDTQGAAHQATFTYSIDNVAPTISLSGAVSVAEGSLYTLGLGVVTDPGPEMISSYTIDWGDGTIDSFSGDPANTTRTHVYADGPAARTYDVTLTDDDGTFLAGSLSVLVLNVAPTLVISGAASVDEGSAYTLSLSSFDPGADAIDHWMIAWGDGTVDMAPGNPAAVSHTYADGDNVYTISATATDEDGTFAATTDVEAFVTNANPSAPADIDEAPNGVAEGADQGTLVGITARSADPGDDSIGYILLDDAGGRFAIDAGTGVIRVAMAALLDYESATAHDVTVLAVDEDGGEATSTFTIAVGNVDPTAPVDVDAAENELPVGSPNGTPAGITAAAADPNGPAVIFSLTDSAGGRFAIDASTGVVTVADAGLLVSNAVYTIVVQASDGAGGASTASFTVRVLSANTLLDRLIACIVELRQQGTLNNGQANSLIVKLNGAQKSLDRGDRNTAVNHMNSFKHEVEAIRGHILTTDQADSLLDKTDEILAAILFGQ